jgi:hypothetical protein
MLKKFFIIGISVICFFSNIPGQTTSSPYSLFAIGQIEGYGTGTNHALGGTGIAFKSKLYLNNLNPASYNGIDSLSFIFEVGLFSRYNQYKTHDERNTHFNANIRYLAMGCRLTRWWATSAGIIPYSSVGYKIGMNDIVEGDLTYYYKTFEGSGGINQFYWAHSISLFKNLSAGVNLSYYLGSIVKTETGTTSEGYLTYELTRSDKVHTFNVDYGVQYTLSVRDLRYTLGIIYSGYKKFNTHFSYTINFDEDTLSLDAEKSNYYLPQKVGIGLGIEKGMCFKTGFDYEIRFWPDNSSFHNSLLNIRDSERFSLGMEYTPYRGRGDQNWKKLFFRMGVCYTKTYMIIDKIPINSVSFMFGTGIPIRKELNMINLSLEAGQTGTLQAGLIREDFLLLHVNITLHDIWFIKYNID